MFGLGSIAEWVVQIKNLKNLLFSVLLKLS